MSDPVADAIQELRSITRCLCEPAWTDRGKHAVECVAYCREDVDLLAAEIEQLKENVYFQINRRRDEHSKMHEAVAETKQARAERDEALSLLRELVDIYRRSNGSVEELYEAMGRAYALAERTIPGGET